MTAGISLIERRCSGAFRSFATPSNQGGELNGYVPSMILFYFFRSAVQFTTTEMAEDAAVSTNELTRKRRPSAVGE